MKNQDLSALFLDMAQKMTCGDGVDVRHDTMFSRRDLGKMLSLSQITLAKAIKYGDFPEPIRVAGQDRWPSSLINEFIYETNPRLQAKEELRAQAIKAIKEMDLS